MTSAIRASPAARTGLDSPVSFALIVALLVVSPIFRGGNRALALMLLEALALASLVVIAWHRVRDSEARVGTRASLRLVMTQFCFWSVLLSPLWLALVYLTPLPLDWWAALPARMEYLRAMSEAGVNAPAALPLSVVPMATAKSLLAGLPLLAAFLAGRLVSMNQLRILGWAVFLVAVLEVLLSLFQVAGGNLSIWHFGVPSKRPIGTFANSNHLASYLGMALMLTLWLALASLERDNGRYWHARSIVHASAHAQLGWSAALALLVLGVLMTLSRGAILSTVPLLGIAAVWIGARVWRGEHAGLWTTLVLASIAGAALAVLGVGSLLARFAPAELADSADFRAMLALRSLQAAGEFWPWGAGWGTYPQAFQRFQPDSIVGYVGHAHQDYVELLFDGGIFALVLMAAVGWLLVQRAAQLGRRLATHNHVRRETLAMVLCGLGLAGFLLHSLVDFNMRIPANAILAALLAGVYLRPLREEPAP